MTHTELYAMAAGKLPKEDPVEAFEKEEAKAFAASELREWNQQEISKNLLRGLEEKAEDYTTRAMEQSTPFGDQKLCSYFLTLAVTLRKVVTYARTGKYSD